MLSLYAVRFAPLHLLMVLSGKNPSEQALPVRHTVIDAIPVKLRASIIAGTNREDLTPYINSIVAKGGVVDTLAYTYTIKSRLLPATGTHLIGHGKFLADKAFTDAGYGDGLNMMLHIVSGLNVSRGVTFDGNSITKLGFWLTGARNTGPVSSVVLDGVFKNLPFNGIDISRNNGAWANANVTVRGTISNVGWTGANLEGVSNLNHDNLHVLSTGWHGIHVGYSTNVHGDGFYVNKGSPPYRIYDGSGAFRGVEKGFLFSHFSTTNARWTRFKLYDNRHAGFDGFGIGEDGPLADRESSDIYAQGEVWYAGLFGFDVSSNMKADIKVYYPTYQGVQFGLDLGGRLSNIYVRARVYNNQNDEAARFSATGAALRNISTTAGSPVVTIQGGSGFFVVPGQKVLGTDIWAGTMVEKVSGSRVTLSTSATRTHPPQQPVSVVFRGVIHFENCHLYLTTVGVPYGVGIESGADGFATYSNSEVTGNLSDVKIRSVRPLNGAMPCGLLVTATQKMTE